MGVRLAGRGRCPRTGLWQAQHGTATHPHTHPLSAALRRIAAAYRPPPTALGSGKRGAPRGTGHPTSSFVQSSAVVAGLSIASSVLKMTDLAPSRSSPAARKWLAWSGCHGAASIGTASCKRPPQPQRALTGVCLSLACGRLRTCIAVMLCRLPERRIGRQSHIRNRKTRHTAVRRAGQSKRPRLSRRGAGALCRRRRTWTPGATPGRTGRTGSVPAAAAQPRPRRRPVPAHSCRRPRHTAAGRAAQSARSAVSQPGSLYE